MFALKMSREPPTLKGAKLICTHELPASVKHVFKFPLFNAVQSKCFKSVYENDDNFVLSAPTGSGKTAVLELAICRLAVKSPNHDFKVIYQAPTRSLCSERQKDWAAKFNHLGLKCAELTGDTDVSQLRHVKTADIIVTTPEKWDSMTRRWKDHKRLLELVRLFLIDEVHILKEDRGASLEAVVSRMKSIGTNVRFVALSATVPNSEDIATWLGINNRMPGMPANREVFDETFRPVELQKHVYGIQANGRNDFAFDQTCNNQLYEVITRYSAHQKPIMVFCMTRRSTEVTAQQLATWWMEVSPQTRPWHAPSNPIQVEDQSLRKLTRAAVAFHHAGLSPNDRSAVQQGYLTGKVNVICCTSTLAVGVNLPCHLVIIKNTIAYQAEGCKEYSDLEIMQMLGRAGRPQFDDSAVAVIMTRAEKVEKYEKMVSGQETLESKLHLNLIEHLNAEISLGTIRDVGSARTWIKGTFLFVRLQRNPDHYNLQTSGKKQNVESLVDSVSAESLEKLHQNQLVEKDNNLRSTEFGDAMARYYVQFDTMKLFLGLQPKAKISEILSALAQASEFKAIRFRSGEKPMYKSINESPSIKFPIQVDLALGPHKVSLIVQAALAGLDMRHDPRFASHAQQLQSETAIVFQHAHRLIRCVIDCQLELEDSVAVRNALEISRSFGARAWDDSPLQMLQIDRLGPVAVRKLAGANIRTVEDLEGTDAQRIDMILSRNPPFGMSILQDVTENFPKLRVSLKASSNTRHDGGRQGPSVHMGIIAEIGFLNQITPVSFKRKPLSVIVLAERSDGQVAHFCRISAPKIGSGQTIHFTASFIDSQQFLTCFVSCDDIAGTQKYATMKPSISSSAFSGANQEENPSRVERNLSSIRKSLQSTSQEAQDSESEEIDDADSFTTECQTLPENVQVNRTQKSALKKEDLSKKDSSKAQEGIDAWHPIRLSNGNWACQHACKDKSSCKHLCCREGLDRPPKRPKNLKHNRNGVKPEATSPKHTSMKDFILPVQPKINYDSKVRPENHPNTSRRRSPQQSTGYAAQSLGASDEFEEMDDFLLDIDTSQQIFSGKEVIPSKGHERGVFVSDFSSPEKASSTTNDKVSSSRLYHPVNCTHRQDKGLMRSDSLEHSIEPLHKKTKLRHEAVENPPEVQFNQYSSVVGNESSVDGRLKAMREISTNAHTRVEETKRWKNSGPSHSNGNSSADHGRGKMQNPPIVGRQLSDTSSVVKSQPSQQLAGSDGIDSTSPGRKLVDNTEKAGESAATSEDDTKEWLLQQFGDIFELV